MSFEPDGEKFELTPFPSSLKAALAYMGEEYTYEYLMGTSGVAFRMVFNPSRWDAGNVDIIFTAKDAIQPFMRAFEAVGYSFEAYGNAARNIETDDYYHWIRCFSPHKDEEFFRTKIIASIQAGKPVIGFGVVGPLEACVVTGYDQAGEVLVGWSYFQSIPEFSGKVEFEKSGYFRKTDWFRNTGAMILIGQKKDKPDRKEIHRKALRWALDVIRIPQVHEHHTGLKAYETWAEFMKRDEDFPDEEEVLFNRNIVLCDAMTMLGEGRWFASLFLADIARHEPGMADELYKAASCFAQQREVTMAMGKILGGYAWEQEKIKKLADHENRHKIVPLILAARDTDAEAAKHIEKALTKIK